MEIINETYFEVQAMPFMGSEDQPVLTIIVKGTHEFGESEPALEQLPINFGDEFFDSKNGGGVKFESDVVPFKPKADIILAGKARTPGSKPRESVDVLLQVGGIGKRLGIFGDRTWNCRGMGCRPTRPKPFDAMDIVYERAFGGMDVKKGEFCAENLNGIGFTATKPVPSKQNEEGKGVFLPNIEDPKNLINSWKDRPKPAGFGCYPRASAPRASYAGTYDEKWRKERAPDLRPEDFQFEYFNCAHPDLQVEGWLAGDEAVRLLNLTPEGETGFTLPKVKLSCTVDKSFELTENSPSPVTESVAMNLDTLCIITEEKRFYQVWRGICPVTDISPAEVKKIRIFTEDWR